MHNKFLEDSIGNKSSRRLFGAILLIIAIILSIFIVIFDVLCPKIDLPAVFKIIELMYITGGSLLGTGVVEFFGNKGKGNE